jgi:signal transduction histidine kinase
MMTVAQGMAQGVVTITDAKEMANLAYKTQYIEDPEGKLTIQDFLQPKMPLPLKPVNNEAINFGITSSFFWLKVNLRNQTDAPLLVKLDLHSLKDILLYETRNGRIVSQFHSGGWMPFEHRAVQATAFIFPLSVPKDSTSTLYLRVQHNRGTEFFFSAGTMMAFYHDLGESNLLHGVYYGFMLLMILYNLFIYFSLRDSSYLYYVLYISLMGLLNATLNGHAFHYLWPLWPGLNNYEDITAALVGMAGILFAGKFLNIRKNAPLFYQLFGVLLVAYIISIGIIVSRNFMLGTIVVEVISLVLVVSFFFAAYFVLKRGYKPAKFFLIAWTLLLLSVIVFILKDFDLLPYTNFTMNALQIGSGLEALLLSMALADRINVYKQEKEQAQLDTLHSLEENRKLITEQNLLLEKRVEERTTELKRTNGELVTALRNLKEMQAQLVQREKMASLGELTAGIAHEIQNPLNFVNNFSEVSTEITDELKAELEKGGSDLAKELTNNLKGNLEKILFHGKRADSIVKSMLEHSRINSGKWEAVDLNALVDEYLRLSYHGLRAKDKNFTAVLETHFDESIGKVAVAPHDLGRVLINLFNNAFYSVMEKMRLQNGQFQPVISVYTKRTDDTVSISIRDNGVGIPEHVQGKIYQPFFTTKPAGEGTGLGLSLSYDIVTKQHGGNLTMDTEEGNYAEFTVQLPINKEA